MTTRPLTNPVYEYWKDKSSKFLFDYSWNLDTVWKNQCNTQHDNRTTLEIPAYADFLPHNWSQNQVKEQYIFATMIIVSYLLRLIIE